MERKGKRERTEGRGEREGERERDFQTPSWNDVPGRRSNAGVEKFSPR